MKQTETVKMDLNEMDLNNRIEMLAEMVTEALIEESRMRVVKRIQTIRNSPEAA